MSSPISPAWSFHLFLHVGIFWCVIEHKYLTYFSIYSLFNCAYLKFKIFVLTSLKRLAKFTKLLTLKATLLFTYLITYTPLKYGYSFTITRFGSRELLSSCLLYSGSITRPRRSLSADLFYTDFQGSALHLSSAGGT